MSERNRLRGVAETAEAEIKRLEDDVGRRLIHAPVSGRLGEVANVRVGSVREMCGNWVQDQPKPAYSLASELQCFQDVLGSAGMVSRLTFRS